MRRFLVSPLVLAFLASLAGPRVAAAQLCSGQPTFDGGRARLYANAIFGRAEAYHAGVALGGSRVFGWAEAGMITYGYDESGEYALGVGAQLSRAERRFHLCPTLVLGISTASRIGTPTGPSYREETIGLGARAGFVLARRKSAKLVPMAAFQYVAGRIKFDYVNGATSTRGIDPYSLVTAGVGLGFDDQFTISPAVVVPLGSGYDWTSYVVTFSIKLPKKGGS